MSRSRLCLLALAVVLTAFVVTSLDLDEDEFEDDFNCSDEFNCAYIPRCNIL